MSDKPYQARTIDWEPLSEFKARGVWVDKIAIQDLVKIQVKAGAVF